MTTAKTTTKRSTAKKATPKASKSSASKKGNPCWPGFEPVPGKTPGTKGSCKPEPGRHSKATKKATQKAAAASKLEKAGKPNPKASK
jgi:hypothetical protein